MLLGVISNVGWTNFNSKIEKLGGLQKVAKSVYMRNMWLLLKTFNTMPTNEDFRALSNSQIDLMLYSLETDHKEMEMARKGIDPNSNQYDESFEEEVWNQKSGDWDILKEGHDADDIARQINDLTEEGDKEKLYNKFDSLEEYNDYLASGGKTTRESEVESYMNRQLEAAEEKAKMMEGNRKGKPKKELVSDEEEAGESKNNSLSETDKKTLEDSIKKLSGNSNSDDDEFTPL